MSIRPGIPEGYGVAQSGSMNRARVSLLDFPNKSYFLKVTVVVLCFVFCPRENYTVSPLLTGGNYYLVG